MEKLSHYWVVLLAEFYQTFGWRNLHLTSECAQKSDLGFLRPYYRRFINECEAGYWRPRCNMDNLACGYKWCSGHGECVKSSSSNNITCACESGWTGLKCDEAIPSATEQLSIGQKLLKEPIWIGMIVMLNLVLFFCVSYVARRKCGKKLSRLMPKRKKPPESASKEASHSKDESSTGTRDIYSLHVELANHENPSKSPTSKTPTKFLFEKVDTSTPPTPNVTRNKKKEAALRFFESYKANNPFPSRTENQHLNKSKHSSSTIQNGTLSFLEKNNDCDKNNTPPPMIRSYTIGTADIEEPSATNQICKDALRHTRSFPSTPQEVRKAKVDHQGNNIITGKHYPTSFKTDIPIDKTEHCYPVIRILNEHNQEEHNSDSENSIIGVSESCDIKGTVKTSSEVQPEYVKIVGSVDSGYPTTPASSLTTNFVNSDSVQNRRSPSANERRKMFGNKAKSKSFYDISYGDGQFSADSSSFSTDMDIDTKAIRIRRSMPSDLNNVNSFDSGPYCLLCRRDKKLDHAETYSCESDLHRLHKPERAYSNDSRTKRKCTCRKCRHRAKSHYRKHIRQYSREVSSLNMSSRYLSDPNLKTYRHRSHRSSSEKFFHTVGSSNSLSERANLRHSTSTDSEQCECSRHKYRTRRKCFKRSEHYSDESYASRSRRPDLASIKNIAASWELSREKSYKRRLLESYLSNVQFSGYSDEISDPQDKYSLNQSASHLQLSPDFNQDGNTSIGSSMSRSPISMSDLTESVERNRQSKKSLTLTDVEVVSSRLSDESDYVHRSLDRLDIVTLNKLENTPRSSSSSDKTDPMFKDSAYQTKQSSVDRYNSIKDRNGAKTKAASKHSDSYRNDDKVRRHLYQAAQKLAMIKRFQTAQEQFSKDSAVYTFSEDDLSTDDQDPRSLRPLVKRTSGLAFQMKEMNLSEVKEECSGMSHGSYNTPNNEPSTDQPEKHRDEHKIAIPMTTKTEQNGTNPLDFSYLDETKV